MINPKTYIIRIKEIQIDNWQPTPKTERLAQLLLETEGKTSNPPLMKRSGKNQYQMISKDDIEIIVAAKRAAQKDMGLIRLEVSIPEKGDSEDDLDITKELLEMKELLKTTVEAKTPTKTKKAAKPRKATNEPSSENEALKAEISKPKTTKPVTPKKVIQSKKTKTVEAVAKKKASEMSYRELQQALKALKKEGKTSIRLNSKKTELSVEWNKLNNT